MATPGLKGLVKSAGEAALLECLAAQIPLGRVENSEETAAVALFPASEDSSLMTGRKVYPNGGTAQV